MKNRDTSRYTLSTYCIENIWKAEYASWNWWCYDRFGYSFNIIPRFKCVRFSFNSVDKNQFTISYKNGKFTSRQMVSPPVAEERLLKHINFLIKYFQEFEDLDYYKNPEKHPNFKNLW